ncbi:alpha/beta hydrolase [Thioclava litoralis]|uniref:Alpha/beta hydrolase n=1 Tax=Thioclava litoralis TaxID=3076557 RepID=A0ABZ1DZH0_9RHOB|nr:alpha/beta hydrolase [Thioclava sp. FTW29]
MTQFFTAADGAKLAYRDEGQGVPVLALSGLTRNMADFDYVAPYLLDMGVRLIRMDYRGRGQSEFTEAATYTVPQEGADALALLDHLGLEKAAILGTSRGGLIAMYLAAVAHDRLLGACLNDVGPKLETAGLNAIFDYLGRNPAAKTYDAMAARLPDLMVGFANVPASRWAQEVRHHYLETPEGLRLRYDPALREPFLKDFKGDLPEAWPFFEAFAELPLCLIRGANSVLLSAQTAAKMQQLRPDMIFAEVADRAHIPFLDEPKSLAALSTWVAKLA